MGRRRVHDPAVQCPMPFRFFSKPANDLSGLLGDGESIAEFERAREARGSAVPSSAPSSLRENRKASRVIALPRGEPAASVIRAARLLSQTGSSDSVSSQGELVGHSC